MHVIKELIENSLDAGGKTVEVLVSDMGLKMVEVRDDGCGMEVSGDCLVKGGTSKLAEFEEVEGVGTYGFRGQALGCLLGLAEVVITT